MPRSARYLYRFARIFESLGLQVVRALPVQVSNAFSKVRESFSIFIANWTTITELRSIHKRLKEFEHNIGY